MRVVPNESVREHWAYLGELVQELVDVGAESGISVELDTSDRTRPGESRVGATPREIVALVVLQGASEALVAELLRRVVSWARRHLRRDASPDQGMTVLIYGPNGDVLQNVRVERGDP